MEGDEKQEWAHGDRANVIATGSKISFFRRQRGVSLVELLIVTALFGIVMAGLYSSYTVQLKQSMTEYKLSQSEMEFQIGKNLIARDLSMAGFGMADDYSGLLFNTRPLEATNSTTQALPDALTLRGTAIGIGTRASQAWSYVYSAATLTTLADARETVRNNDFVIYVEPNTKKLLTSSSTGTNTITGRQWLFPYPAAGTNPHPDPLEDGVVAYAIQTDPADSTKHADFPYYEVSYTRSDSNVPSYCATGTWNLLRSENKKSPGNDPGQPLYNCVADFQVALGIDDSEDGKIDCWDNGGENTAGYLTNVFKKRLKQVRLYILLQQGVRDSNYVYTGSGAGMNANQIRVGDALLTGCKGGGAGRIFTFNNPDQRHYRWKVISLSVAPRNIRE